jgi:hypothetical protein
MYTDNKCIHTDHTVWVYVVNWGHDAPVHRAIAKEITPRGSDELRVWLIQPRIERKIILWGSL